MKIVGCCAYFHDSWIAAAAEHLQGAGVELRLWSLEQPLPGLEAITLGQGFLPKWKIMDTLMAPVPPDFDYAIFFDDDIVLPPDFWDGYLAEVRSCNADLSQPALTADSFASHEITRRDPGCRARITNFVEIGPFVCMSARFYRLAKPYLDPISPLGWGYEAQWNDVARRNGFTQAIIDSCAVRHVRPVASTYSHLIAKAQMQAYLQKYGNPMPVPTIYARIR